MTLREMLFNAIWRCGFAPHEDPAVVEKMKSEWPDDAARVEKLGDAALSALRQWLADEGLVVVPREATTRMWMAAVVVQQDDIQLTPYEIRQAWRAMIAAAPDALKATDPAPSPGAITGMREAETPCSDCIDGWCQLNCGPRVG